VIVGSSSSSAKTQRGLATMHASTSTVWTQAPGRWFLTAQTPTTRIGSSLAVRLAARASVTKCPSASDSTILSTTTQEIRRSMR